MGGDPQADRAEHQPRETAEPPGADHGERRVPAAPYEQRRRVLGHRRDQHLQPGDEPDGPRRGRFHQVAGVTGRGRGVLRPGAQVAYPRQSVHDLQRHTAPPRLPHRLLQRTPGLLRTVHPDDHMSMRRLVRVHDSAPDGGGHRTGSRSGLRHGDDRAPGLPYAVTGDRTQAGKPAVPLSPASHHEHQRVIGVPQQHGRRQPLGRHDPYAGFPSGRRSTPGPGAATRRPGHGVRGGARRPRAACRSVPGRGPPRWARPAGGPGARPTAARRAMRPIRRLRRQSAARP